MNDCKLTITAYDWVPGFAQGHVRDLRVRWALEEAGLPYEVELVPQGTQVEPRNLSRQPFGQIPTLEIDGRAMFESGAILWRIAKASDALLPADPEKRDEVLCWHFAALNTLEPPISMLAMLDLFLKDREAAGRLRPEMAEFARLRLASLSRVLDGKAHLVDDFTVADLTMTTVLRDLPKGMLGEFPVLVDFVRRMTARPAFQAALAGQMSAFAEHGPRYAAGGA